LKAASRRRSAGTSIIAIGGSLSCRVVTTQPESVSANCRAPPLHTAGRLGRKAIVVIWIIKCRTFDQS
jgi:hypothetical protein